MTDGEPATVRSSREVLARSRRDAFATGPLAGAAFGAALLGEAVGAGFLAGRALMGVGIWVVSRERAWGSGVSPERRGRPVRVAYS